MDFLLRRKYSYPVSNSFSTTRLNLEKILHTDWHDLSQNATGTIDDQGGFNYRINILPGMTFSNPGNLRIVYLRGTMEENGKDTIIHTTISPNIILLGILYLLIPLVSLNVLFGDNSLMGTGTRKNNISVLLAVEIAFFLFIQLYTFFLKWSFEKKIDMLNHLT